MVYTLFWAISTTKGFYFIFCWNHQFFNRCLIIRFVVIAWSIGGQRAIIEECLRQVILNFFLPSGPSSWPLIRYITQRKVFGKPLASQPVIRAKLAAMISRTESCQSWLEGIIFQMQNMDYNQQATHLAGFDLYASYICSSMPWPFTPRLNIGLSLCLKCKPHVLLKIRQGMQYRSVVVPLSSLICQKLPRFSEEEDWQNPEWANL